MENLAVITALYRSGCFRNHLSGFRKKYKYYSPAKVGPYWEKLCPLSCVPRPRAQFFPIRTSLLVNNTYFQP